MNGIEKKNVPLCDQVQVDPQLLFRRLIIASQLEEIFQCELCTYPTTLFDSPLILRQLQVPVLEDALWTKLTQEANMQPEGNVRARRRCSSNPSSPMAMRVSDLQVVCDLYCTYTQRKDGRAIVVFDRFDEMSTKVVTQQMRSSGKVGANVTFTESMSLAMKKDNFFSNLKSKQRSLLMLIEVLQNVRFVTHHEKVTPTS